MSYKLRKAPNRDLYWVIDTRTNSKCHENPVPMREAYDVMSSRLSGQGRTTNFLNALDRTTAYPRGNYYGFPIAEQAIVQASIRRLKQELENKKEQTFYQSVMEPSRSRGEIVREAKRITNHYLPGIFEGNDESTEPVIPNDYTTTAKYNRKLTRHQKKIGIKHPFSF